MSNFERIKQMTPEELLNEINMINSHPFRLYIDWLRYFGGEKTPDNYLISDATCKIIPSEMQIAMFKTEYEKSHKYKPSPTEIEKYIVANACDAILLEETFMMGSPYCVVADLHSKTILKVPKENIR